MKIISILILAILASLPSFMIHVFTVEWLPSWIGFQMQGVELKPSWAVRYVAALTSLEYGLGVIAIYYLCRDKLKAFNKIQVSIILSVLLLVLNAMLFRQPLMDMLIGNPTQVVIVQNLFKWLPYVLMSFIVVFGYEFLNKKFFVDE